MSFNFDESVERNHTDSEKWLKYRDRDIIPLWVADTDFRTAPAIVTALHQRVDHGVFGYSDDQGALADTVVNWVAKHYQWQIKPEWVVYLSGMKPVFGLIQECFLSPDQQSVCHTPIYPLFTQSAEQCQRQQLTIPYPIFEHYSPLSTPLPALNRKQRLLLLCNPHNPGGRVYRRHELEVLAHYAEHYDLLVCSDEIHADLVLEDELRHIPFASLSESCAQRSITLLSAAKAFNLAGLGCAVAIIPNDKLRATFTAATIRRMSQPSLLSLTAMTAAWRDAQEWLSAQRHYLRQNRDLLVSAVSQLPGLKIIPPEAGFLAWLETSGLGVTTPTEWFEQHGLGVTDGTAYGDPRAVRINFGCTRALLQEAIARLTKAVLAAPNH